MTNIWVIPPYYSEQPERFDIAWGYDQKNDTIAIGWAKIGNPIIYLQANDNQNLIDRLNQSYPLYLEKNLAPQYASFIRKFYFEIKEGDIILARKGLQQIIGVGVVFKKNNKTAFFDDTKGKERLANNHEIIASLEYYPNFLNVNWNNGFSLSAGTLRKLENFEKIIDTSKLIQ